MTALPYMPLHIVDYRVRTQHLRAAGHGAYLLLLMTYWQLGGGLPDDDRILACMACMSDEEWKAVREDVRAFFTVRNGLLVQDRADRELGYVRAKIKQTSRAGKASAKRRAGQTAMLVELPLNGCSTPVQRSFNDTNTNTDTDTDSEKDKNINPISSTSDSSDIHDRHPGLDLGSRSSVSDESPLSLQDRPNAQDGASGSGFRVKLGMTAGPASVLQLMPLSPQAVVAKLPKTNVRASEQAKRYFAEFWAIYPKRICGIAAEERFYAALKSRVAPQRILDGARRYAESVKGTEAIYISAPDVWLAKGRYDDEYARPPPRENLMTRLARGDWETNDGCAASAKLEYAGPDVGGTKEPTDALAQCPAPDLAGPL